MDRGEKKRGLHQVLDVERKREGERERRREAREIYGIVEAARVLVAVLAHERARW